MAPNYCAFYLTTQRVFASFPDVHSVVWESGSKEEKAAVGFCFCAKKRSELKMVSDKKRYF